jgi:CO/xanthine dehydrogenase FAD-binding subunit
LAAQSEHSLLAEAPRWIGHAAIRTRGTLGGSLAHADPAAELPVAAAAVGAVALVAGPGGPRRIAARDLFAGALQTCLDDDELIEAVEFPALGPAAAEAILAAGPLDTDRINQAAVAAACEIEPASEIHAIAG